MTSRDFESMAEQMDGAEVFSLSQDTALFLNAVISGIGVSMFTANSKTGRPINMAMMVLQGENMTGDPDTVGPISHVILSGDTLLLLAAHVKYLLEEGCMAGLITPAQVKLAFPDMLDFKD